MTSPAHMMSGSNSGYGSEMDDCCPPVVDPLLFCTLLAFIAAATYFFQELIAMSMLMKPGRRSFGSTFQLGKKSNFHIHQKISKWRVFPFVCNVVCRFRRMDKGRWLVDVGNSTQSIIQQQLRNDRQQLMHNKLEVENQGVVKVILKKNNKAIYIPWGFSELACPNFFIECNDFHV